MVSIGNLHDTWFSNPTPTKQAAVMNLKQPNMMMLTEKADPIPQPPPSTRQTTADDFLPNLQKRIV